MAIIPFTIIRTREPIYALPVPNRHQLFQVQPDFLDELWLDPATKSIPYRVPILQLLHQNRLVTLLFQLADLFLCLVVWCRLTLLRHHSLSVCTQWLLDRQEPSGNWAGLYTAHLAITALLLQGHTLASDPVRRGIDDLRSDGFLFRHEAQTDANSKHSKQGLWMQSCVSPVWDTFLMVRGLLDTAPVPPNSTDTTTNINPTAPLIPDDEAKVDTNTLITTALAWARPRQITTHPLPSSKTTLSPFKADWSIPRPLLPPGAFSFEYSNTHYPDIDDTVIGLLNYLIHDPSPSTLYSPLVIRATTWIMGMQNKTDGGWAAFDTDNDSYWLNGLPFSDIDALCDGSSPDAAGHVVEGFGVLLKVRKKVGRGDGGEKMDGEVRPNGEADSTRCLRGLLRRAGWVFRTLNARRRSSGVVWPVGVELSIWDEQCPVRAGVSPRRRSAGVAHGPARRGVASVGTERGRGVGRGPRFVRRYHSRREGEEYALADCVGAYGVDAVCEFAAGRGGG